MLKNHYVDLGDSVDQDQTAQNVRSDLGSALSKLCGKYSHHNGLKRIEKDNFLRN